MGSSPVLTHLGKKLNKIEGVNFDFLTLLKISIF